MFSLDDASAIPRIDTSTRSSWRQRRNLANTNALSQYEADLTSKDRYKQKEAVRRFLAEKVKNDWSFQWPSHAQSPSVNSQALSKSDTDMTCDFLEEEEWKEREEWLSDAGIETGDDEQDHSILISSPGTGKNSLGCSEITEKTENSLNTKIQEFMRKRKVELQKELAYNDGLRCFTARRDAWTGARVIHKIVPASSPSLSLDQPMKENYGDKIAVIDQYKSEDIIVPVGRLILPAENFLRSSITPRSYSFIYDKIVLNSITPTCPINLRDMIKSCVQGWKRDGQWPPPSIEVNRLSQKKSDHQALSSLFTHDVSDYVLDEATRRGENEEKKESIDEQSQRQRGRAREKNSKEIKERNKGLNSCFHRILGRSL
ncbi:hypothetical protein EPUL_001613 [Erysiphe pulchra]|uniref:Gag1-like clamp domain-containing protein n=1 Tax=Erysiphe pulchra TaxID=225359 RepID=A0A2S4Q001_9PEZI|nr:hypothetical protein EPUL_001613 [Erysiphe pulchra]